MKTKILTRCALILLTVFFFSCAEDEVKQSPTVIATDPINLDNGATIESSVSATFNQEMNPQTFGYDGFTLYQDTVRVSGTIVHESSRIIFIPTEKLEANRHFTAHIASGVQSKDGDRMVYGYTWSFSTNAGE